MVVVVVVVKVLLLVKKKKEIQKVKWRSHYTFYNFPFFLPPKKKSKQYKKIRNQMWSVYSQLGNSYYAVLATTQHQVMEIINKVRKVRERERERETKSLSNGNDIAKFVCCFILIFLLRVYCFVVGY